MDAFEPSDLYESTPSQDSSTWMVKEDNQIVLSATMAMMVTGRAWFSQELIDKGLQSK